MIIDVWGQPPSSGFINKLPEIQRLFAQSGQSELLNKATSDPDWSLEPKDLIQLMDEAGVQKIFLTAWCGPKGWIVTNEEVYRYVAYNPSRIFGVGTVNLNDPVEAVKEIERCILTLHFKGIRILPWIWNKPPNDKLYYPLYVKCIELNVPFCCQVGHTGPLYPSDVGRPIPYIDEIALTFPKLKILGGHIGYPWTDEMISLAWKHANVYIDTSAYDPQYYPSSLVHFMKTYGKHKVLFATNYPMLTLQQCVSHVKVLKLSDEVKDLFLWKNASNFFGLDSNKPKL